MRIDDERKKIFLNSSDSYDEFKKSKLHQKKNNSSKILIDKKLYIQIVAKYISIWLYDFLWSRGTYYFPFGYNVSKYKTVEKYSIDTTNRETIKARIYKQTKANVGIFWHRFDCDNIMRFFTIRKITGVGNLFPEAEKEWKKYFSVYELLNLIDKKAKENKKREEYLKIKNYEE